MGEERRGGEGRKREKKKRQLTMNVGATGWTREMATNVWKPADVGGRLEIVKELLQRWAVAVDVSV